MEKPVFILGAHKSGTSLLRSLLDGAVELFVVPIEAHFFQYGGFWVDYALRRSLPSKVPPEDLVANYAQHIRRSNERASQTSDSVLVGCWDIERFVDYLHEAVAGFPEKGDLRSFIDGYIEAMHVSLYGTVPTVTRFVEKSVENAEYATVLKQLYPRAKFVHVVRDPNATLVAIRRHMARPGYPFLGTALASLSNSYYYLYKNPLLISDYLVIRYEDLVARTRDVMANVAQFIDIEFTESLLEPTVMGRAWGGNSTTGIRFEGVSCTPLVTWKSEIEPLEIGFVNRLFGHVLRDHRYVTLDIGGSVYRPASRETLKAYVMNRCLWRFVVRSGSTFA